MEQDESSSGEDSGFDDESDAEGSEGEGAGPVKKKSNGLGVHKQSLSAP